MLSIICLHSKLSDRIVLVPPRPGYNPLSKVYLGYQDLLTVAAFLRLEGVFSHTAGASRTQREYIGIPAHYAFITGIVLPTCLT